MFTLNEDKSIYATRGDIVFFSVTAEDDGKPYQFKPGDVVRIKVYGKKDTENVVLQKDFPVTAATDKVQIYLDRADTKIGEVISKPKDYWYSVTLNDDTVPQTIIGYDEDGAKVFKLFPEGADIPPYEPIKPEDIPVVDVELDLTSDRPVENRSIARAVVRLNDAVDKANEEFSKRAAQTDVNVANVAEAVGVERARIDNLISEEGKAYSAPLEYMEYITAETKAKLDATIQSDGVHATITVNFREANQFYGESGMDVFVIPAECRPIDVGTIHTEDGLVYSFAYIYTKDCYVLNITASSDVSVAPSGAGSVNITYALADYEVKDIRVGTDGKVYPSAGAAVREQIGAISKVSENLYNAEADVLGYVITEKGEFNESNTFKYSDLIEIGLGVTFTLKGAKAYGGTDGATYLIKYYKNPDTGTITFNGRVVAYGMDSYTATTEGYNLIRVVSHKNAAPFMVNIGDELLEYTPYGARVVYRECVEYAFAEELKQIKQNTADIADNAFAIDAWVDITDAVTSGGVVNSGGTGTVVDFTPVVSAGWKHAIIPCLKNDKFKVTGTSGDKYRLWCFTDADGVVLNKSAGSISGDGVEISAPGVGYLVLNFSTGGDCVVMKCPTLTDTAISAEWSRLAVSGVLGRAGAGCYPFGVGIDCNYETPEIGALEVPEDRLAYFYGLYDELAERHPNYITKIDCDAEALNAGIEIPEHISGYPTYMYKFSPAYAPNGGGIDVTETSASKLKVFIVSGTHPEYMSMYDLYHAMRLICEKWKEDDNLDALRWECEFYVMPCSAPYCVQHASRTNYNGVNLNRNMPTKNWAPSSTGTEYSGASAASEYETKVLVHYHDLIAPHIFIDHHNTNVGDHKNLMYVTSALQSCVDVGANHISTMTRRWKKRYSNVFPMDDVIYGFSRITQEKGTRSEYACENGAFGFTYESQEAVSYSNGVLNVDKAQKRTALCSTLATDGLLNFLLKVLKTLGAKVI